MKLKSNGTSDFAPDLRSLDGGGGGERKGHRFLPPSSLSLSLALSLLVQKNGLNLINIAENHGELEEGRGRVQGRA